MNKEKVFALLLFFIAHSAHAFVVEDFGAWARMAKQFEQSLRSYAQEYQILMNTKNQLQQQLEMVKNQGMNLKNLPNINIDNINPILDQLDGTLASGKGLAYSSSNLKNRFDTLFPGINNDKTINNYQQNYKDRSEAVQANNKNALDQLAQIQARSKVINEKLEAIKKQKASGNLQGLNQISNLMEVQAQQQQVLQETLQSQINRESIADANREQEKANIHAVQEKFYGGDPGPMPKYNNHDGVGLFPTFQ